MTQEEFDKLMGKPTGQLPGSPPQTAQAAPGSTISPPPTPGYTPQPDTSGRVFTKIETGNGPPAIDLKKNPGMAVEGSYTGNRGITTKIGPQIVWQFNGPHGPFGVFGFTSLNRALQQVQVGEYIRMTYTGKEQVKNSKGVMVAMHQCNVEKA